MHLIDLGDTDLDLEFPSTDYALSEPNGLLCSGGNLNPNTLINAYCNGIFPWFMPGQPLLWWSPDPRCVIFAEDLHISRSKHRAWKRGKLHCSWNLATKEVIDGCAALTENRDATWISSDIRHAYLQLAALGHVQSVEVWAEDELVGGVYGIAIGEVFCGESMFSKREAASSRALYEIFQANYRMIDAQITNPHLITLGAKEIRRVDFLALLKNPS